jgi:pilus assembly protein CpaD
MTRDHNATAARPRSRSSLVRATLLAGCASLLAGCYYAPLKDPTAYAPPDYRLRHPIVVKEKDHTVELFIGNNRGSLNADQRADIVAFARTWRREATGGIVIETPAGTRNANAAREAAHEARATLVASGVPAHGVVVRSYSPANPHRLATVRLNYPRMGAEAGPCGLWPADIGPSSKGWFENNAYWNLGCASQRNLAAMVANPADLVQPRGEGAVYQERRTFQMEQYRTGKATWSAEPPAQQKAKIGEVGR